MTFRYIDYELEQSQECWNLIKQISVLPLPILVLVGRQAGMNGYTTYLVRFSKMQSFIDKISEK